MRTKRLRIKLEHAGRVAEIEALHWTRREDDDLCGIDVPIDDHAAEALGDLVTPSLTDTIRRLRDDLDMYKHYVKETSRMTTSRRTT